MKPCKILVMGTGGIGGFYAARLSNAGAEVSLHCRSDYDRVRDVGITVESVDHPDEDYHFTPAAVLRGQDKPAEMPDYLLVALKVLPEIDVPSLIAPYVGPETAIVLVQNGVEIEAPIAAAFPNNDLISALAFICVFRPEPGRIKHVDYGRLVIGNYPSGAPEKTQRLSDLFNAGGVDCEATGEVCVRRWIKLVWNAPFNPMSVLAGGVTTQEMQADPVAADCIREVMLEVWSLAEAAGCGFPVKIIDDNIEYTRTMAPYKTSMLLDFEAGRPMEVEAILGNAVRVAERVNVQVPRIATMYANLRLLDKKNLERA